MRLGQRIISNLIGLINSRTIQAYAPQQIGPEKNSGAIETVALILHGTRETPEYRKNGPRVYNQDYNRMRKTVS